MHSCHNDNLQWRQWRQSWHHDNSQISLNWLYSPAYYLWTKRQQLIEMITIRDEVPEDVALLVQVLHGYNNKHVYNDRNVLIL